MWIRGQSRRQTRSRRALSTGSVVPSHTILSSNSPRVGSWIMIESLV